MSEQISSPEIPDNSVVADIAPTEAPIEIPQEGLTGFSEEYKTLVETKGFQGVDDVLKSYENLERMVGGSIRLPSEDSSEEYIKEFHEKLSGIEGVAKIPTNDEEKAAFYNKLGRPEEAINYSFGEASEAFDPALETKFKEIAHSIGLTNEQAKSLAEFEASFIPSEEQLQQQQDEYNNKAASELKGVWGDDFDNRSKVTLEVLNKYGDKHPEAVEELKNAVGNNPALRIMLADLAEAYQEKGTPVGSTRVGMSSEQAGERISELKLDTGFMQQYLDARAPGHKEAVAKMTELYQKKHSG